MLENGDFTGGFTHETIYWTDGGATGPFYTEFDNIVAPAGWKDWWVEGVPEFGDPASGRVTGRPEVKLISLDKGTVKGVEHFPDPERFLPNHMRAIQYFTFWRTHYGGLAQVVDTEPGRWYRVAAWMHSWYSQCSDRPHEAPYESDCARPATWARADFYLGAGPSGVIAPLSPGVIWTPPVAQYGVYDVDSPIVLEFQATGNRTAIYTCGTQSHALKHDDDYIGEVVMEEITTPPQDWRRQVAEQAAILDDVAASLRAIANGGALRLAPGRPYLMPVHLTVPA